jgi:hypothetical protein
MRDGDGEISVVMAGLVPAIHDQGRLAIALSLVFPCDGSYNDGLLSLSESMHLKSMHLKEFRGFSDLTLLDIPAGVRLIMLIGPNGTGKSSIFDALLIWSGVHGQLGFNWDTKFHVKQSALQDYNWPQSIEKIEFHEGRPETTDVWKKLCYFRSAYRNEVELTQGNLGILPEPYERRFGRTIENDAAVSANYRRLVMQTIKDVWGSGPKQDISLPDYAGAVIKKVNDSLNRVLPHLQMESLGDPNANAGNFYFTKGISKRYPFNNLSGGEKAVFDLLIDLISKMPYFGNARQRGIARTRGETID